MRSGSKSATALAMLMGVVGALAMVGTASEAVTAVAPLMVIAVALHVTFLLLDSARWVGVASLPMGGAIVLESGFGDNPSWIRSLTLGCWWFVTMEMSWEAIERANNARYTNAATARRVQEVATVVGVAMMVGLVASVLATAAPARTVLVQAIVLGGLLAVFIALIRQVTASQD